MKSKWSAFVKRHKILILILLLTTALRTYAVTQNPPSLNWDEVSHGYNAYSILKTGHDEWGNFLPTIFRAYGDYKLPVYIYATSFSVAIFGLNSFSVRLPSIVAGITIVLFTYLLASELFNVKRKSKENNNNHIALLAALLVAVEPWSVFVSRVAVEANLAMALIVSGVYFFYKGLRNPKNLTYSAILLGLSAWTYNSARIFVPLFLAAIIYLYRSDLLRLFRKKRKTLITSLILLLMFIAPMFWQLTADIGQARYAKVAILDEGAIAEINEARSQSDLGSTLARVIHNKGTKFASRFINNWASHYTGSFLYFEGGTNYQFSVPGTGILYWFNVGFLLIGVASLIKARSREKLIILLWFFAGSIPSSITREAPHVLRAITMLPTPMIITAVGFMASVKFLKRKLPISYQQLTVAYLFLAGVFLWGYVSVYFGNYRREYSWSWQYGYKQVANFTKENYNEYDKIIISKKYGEPHEFILFYWPWDPLAYRNDPNLLRFEQSDWFWVDRFDKFYFVNDWQIDEEITENNQFVLESGGLVECKPPGISDDELKLIEVSSSDKCLLVTSPGNVPSGWKKIGVISYPNNKLAFEIYEN